MKEERAESIDLTDLRERDLPREALHAAREMVIREAAEHPTPKGRVTIRQMDRISALTGAPWAVIYTEARNLGV